MAFPFLYSWWHYSDKEAVASLTRKETSCEEEEEEDDEICWFLGEMLLFYCLAVVILKLGYLGVNRFFLRQPCGTLSCNWMAQSKGSPGCACRCHCKVTVCGLLRKLFGGTDAEGADGAPGSPPIKKRLKRRLSLLSQQTFCDSDSSGSATLDSQVPSWKWSQTGDGVSVASRQSKRAAPPKVRQQPCLRCKAKRTREWLVQHFYRPDSALQGRKTEPRPESPSGGLLRAAPPLGAWPANRAPSAGGRGPCWASAADGSCQ